MLKLFSGEKILSRLNGAQKWRFWWKIGVETLDFGFATPKRHSFDVFCVKIGARCVLKIANFRYHGNRGLSESNLSSIV